MAGRSILTLAVCGALLALGLYLFFRAPKRDERSDDPVGSESEGDPSAPGAAAEHQRTGSPGHPVLDRKRADEMRDQIRALMGEAGPAWAPLERAVGAARTGYPEMPAPVGSANANQAKEAQGRYIQSVMKEQFFPLAGQCYDNMSAKHPLKVVLDFRIVGDKRVGGVVDQASLSMGDGGAPLDPEFERCMTESMMSVSFAAPPNEREVTVTYPIELAPDPPD